jgi:hypothetical protein
MAEPLTGNWIEEDDAFLDEIFSAPLDDDERERIARWRNAPPERRGATLADLMRLVDAIGWRYPKRDRWPGFPCQRRNG